VDPLLTSKSIEDHYRRYLGSAFAPRSERFRRAFEEAVASGLKIAKGPYLQASPPFVRGAAPSDLIDEGILSSAFRNLDGEQFPIHRKFYLHQEEALRKAVRARRNLVIATGTGSGKTECFLIPIIEHLYREREAGSLTEPGVRALLLYPMNALANDQLKRLRRLLASESDITFGRYVGETRGKKSDAEDDFRARYPGEPRVPNEVLSREEMQARPPHILLTNYAMLEYLLLRPADSPIFDEETGGHWRFIALDEAHVYDGAEGTEIAMLLRRVKDRVVASEKGRLQCFATSATLGAGPSDYPKLVEFASDLFGEPFEWVGEDAGRQDVVGPAKEPMALHQGSIELSHEQMRDLREAVAAADGHLSEVVAALSASHGLSQDRSLDELLQEDKNVVGVQRSLESGAKTISVLTNQVLGAGGDAHHLVSLVDLASRVQSGRTDASLIPARYHLFLRALEGAFVCLHPEHDSREPFLLLARHERCPSCTRRGLTSTMFELGICRRCGAEYLAGQIVEGRVQTATRSSGLDFLLLTSSLAADNEDELAESDDDPGHVDESFLCPQCGVISETASSKCDCGNESTVRTRVLLARPAKGSDVLRRCPACSGRANMEIVNRFLTSSDAPVSTIGTALYQELSPDRSDQARYLVGEGRRLLLFSDSRQAAAFLAPYLERTYNVAIHRRMIYQVLIDQLGERMRFDDIVHPLSKIAEDSLVLDPDESSIRRRTEVARWLMQEVIGADRRSNLEGTGLMEIQAAVPRKFQAPRPLLSLGFSEEEALDLIHLLLGTLRSVGAVNFPPDVDVREQIFAPRNREIGVREQGSEPGVVGWVPVSASNSRLEILSKVFARKQIEADPRDLLRRIWVYLTDPDGPWAKVLVGYSDRIRGQLWRLSYERLEFLPLSPDHRPFLCDTCRSVWWKTIADVCSSYGCGGTLHVLEDPESVAASRFAHLYQTLRPLGMNVQEHTAQWTQSEASKVQDRFMKGELNVLSCSTTFELGVDVGEVEAVLLRNVPPSPANYIQRAGRAGRRVDSTALAVTFSQRRAHDLAYFDDPTRMVDGAIAAPRIVLENRPITRRHVHSVAFAAYERAVKQHRTVEDFFESPSGESREYENFIDWLRTRPQIVGDALERLVPAGVKASLGIRNWEWVDALVEPSEQDPTEGWLQRAAAEVNEEVSTIDELILQATGQKKFDRAAYLQRQRRTLSGRDLLGFLASRNVLPKYGFPVDVVSLNLARTGDDQAARLELDRDLKVALAEYAPGAEIVAGKTLWRSIGLTARTGREWPVRHWGICKQCGAFRQGSLQFPEECTVCGSSECSLRGHFVIPIFGFVGERSKQSPGDAQPGGGAFAETFFSEYQEDDPSEPTEMEGFGRPVSVRYSRQGRITVINRGPMGRGFRLCGRCGYSEPAPTGTGKAAKPPKEHRDVRMPGRRCSATMHHRQLGHEYLTDVLEIRVSLDMSYDQARSALYALLEGAARALSIKRDDIDGTLHRFSVSDPYAFILFDKVPGGAGHVQEIGQNLPSVIQASVERVSNCECGEETSCYSCLRNYWNQMWHEVLSRRDALQVLNAL
jgi:ATP-dependent helicase YprA (DUF1998 family)